MCVLVDRWDISFYSSVAWGFTRATLQRRRRFIKQDDIRKLFVNEKHKNATSVSRNVFETDILT